VPRGLGVAPRNSIRVAGEARHEFGVASVEINGTRASLLPDPSGALRFVGYAVPRSETEPVEVVVRGVTGAPLVKHFPVSVLPAATVAAAAGPPRVFRGKRWAVVVGISSYSDSAIAGLRFADDDAQAFHDFLRSERAGGGGFAAENVKLLLNEAATYREIRSALFTFLKGATEDDQVVIYFAGHGAPDPQRLQNLYLLTHDTDAADISGTAFPMDDVNRAIRNLYARDILVITDACHSAAVGGQVATRDLGVNQINEMFLQQLGASTGGLAIFTASAANQLSQEDERWGGGHGVFTHFLLEGLGGQADEDGDRIVSLVEMMEYARGKVRGETRNAQIPSISQTSYDPYLPMAIVLDPSAAPPVPAVAQGPAPTPTPASAARTPAPAAPTREQADAITRFQEAVRLYPRSAAYRKSLGVALRQAGRRDEALVELREAVTLDGANPEHHYELGIALREAGVLKDASSALASAVRLDPRNGDYWNAYGAALLEEGQADEALDRFRRAVRLAPENARYHRDLGAALRKSGRPQDAVAEYREAVRLAPASAAYHRELAETLIETGRAADAVVELREAVRADGASAENRFALGVALREGGQLAEAKVELQKAVELQPANAAYRYEAGRLLRELGMPYEGIVEFREAVRLEPGRAAFRFALGSALRGASQAEDAVRELREAVKLDPAQAEHHHGLALALKAVGLPQEAMPAFREAVRLAPQVARFRFDLGVFLRELGELEQAVAELQAAVQLDGEVREYREELNATRRRLRN
ncbi:MAG TPA: tetratricopeptide repeat protein, partial [Longimicrobiaceae bacterium]|nr:tetratricopeptide repeat protein [Longimicrobiaceae bacterium]